MRGEESSQCGSDWTHDDLDNIQNSHHGDDGVVEVRNIARVDTQRVYVWRSVLAGTLLITAVAVSLGTYISLETKERDKFKTAVSEKERLLPH